MPVEQSSDRRRRNRTFLAVAIVTVLVIAAAAWWAAARAADDGSLATPGDTGTAGEGAAGAGAAERSFAWIARPEGPFTDGQVRELASGYAYVVMDRAHGGADIATQLDDARRIKQANPATKVLVYVNAALWYDTNSLPDGWDAPYDPAWSLPDPSGAGALRFTGASDRGLATFVDLGNAAYRANVLRLIASWLGQAPIDGIAFDTVQPAAAGRGVLGHPGITWNDVLPGARLDRYNAGLVSLLRDTKALLGPGREVMFNGIADTPLAENRNLGLVDDADAAVDENFCVDNAVRHEPDKLRADLALMADLAHRGKRLLEKTNTRNTVPAADVGRLGRYCAGAFLLGWQPGSTFFKFGPDYSVDELRSNPAEIDLPLGRPLREYGEDAGIARRDFENGMVLVNLSGRPGAVRAPMSGTLWSGGTSGPVRAGDAVPVSPWDAVFVVGRPPS